LVGVADHAPADPPPRLDRPTAADDAPGGPLPRGAGPDPGRLPAVTPVDRLGGLRPAARPGVAAPLAGGHDRGRAGRGPLHGTIPPLARRAPARGVRRGRGGGG